PHLVVVRTYGQLQVDAVADDVVLHAAVDGADGDHRPLQRADLAADDALQGDDDVAGHQHRVDAQMRIGAVRADAVHGDVDAVGAGGDHGQGDLDAAGLDAGRDVEGQGVVGPG